MNDPITEAFVRAIEGPQPIEAKAAAVDSADLAHDDGAPFGDEGANPAVVFDGVEICPDCGADIVGGDNIGGCECFDTSEIVGW